MLPRTVPELPQEVVDLADDIRLELMDAEHILRLHGRRSSYTAGCHGPLCKRADRIWNREHYRNSRIRAGKRYQPSDLRRDDRDDELDEALRCYMQHAKAIEIHVRLTELYKEIEEAV